MENVFYSIKVLSRNSLPVNEQRTCTSQDTYTRSHRFRVYRTDFIPPRKKSFLPCGVTARTKNIYLFWGCGIEKREFLAYFGACQAKIPVRGWCKLNISRVRS